jgi:hypothetical protein
MQQKAGGPLEVLSNKPRLILYTKIRQSGFLYYHAIELYLKSFLRKHGHSASELRGKNFGHKTCCLYEKAKELGLVVDDEALQVFSLMATTDAIIRSRYIEIGFVRWPILEALDRTCKSLTQLVGDAFKKSGEPVRL